MKEHYKINEAVSDLSEPAEPYPKETKRLIPEMKVYLRRRDLSYTIAMENGWYPTEKVRESDPVIRIVIPATNKYGRPYWQARAMLPHNLRYRSAKGGRFGSIILVWPLSPVRHDSRKPVILCEGPMDALAAAGLGYFSIATMGALFSSYAVKWVDENIDRKVPVIVIPDLDLPDFGTENVAALAKTGRRVVMCLPEGGNDLAKMSKKAREALLK